MLIILGQGLTAALAGAMIFFAVLMAPSVFRFLEPPVAGRFIRQFFPIYYLSLGIATILAMLLLLLGGQVVWGTIMGLVATGFFVAYGILMPKINSLRDAMLQGDEVAKRAFHRWHGSSVVLNTAQLLTVILVVVLGRSS